MTHFHIPHQTRRQESLKITEKDLEQNPILHSDPHNESSTKYHNSEDSDDNMTGLSTGTTLPGTSVYEASSGSGSGSTNRSTSTRTVQYEEDDPTTWDHDVLIKLYVFADRFDIRRLRADSLDALIGVVDNSRKIWDPLYIRFIYTNTPSQSGLRKYTVERTAYRCSVSVKDAEWETCPREFLEAVMITNGRRLPYKQCHECYYNAMADLEEEDFLSGGLSRHQDLPSYERDPCFYHEHSDDEAHEACRKRREISED